MRTRFGLVSLGCDKNTVDSERIAGALGAHGARMVSDLAAADVILVNTCGFIDAAKEESIQALLDVARYKDEGRCRAVVAMGCLVERYEEELRASLPEVDLFVGLREAGRLLPELQARGLASDPLEGHPGVRRPLGDRRHVRYLKISEGCDHGCAFCAIPLWRGQHRSFDPDALVEEARRLEGQGAVELNLVAQDLAHYGREWRNGTDIAALVRRLLDGTSIPWIRLLYVYSAGLREPLVELMASEPRLLPYIDMPIQHASDTVLRRMRRPERREGLRRKIAWLRDAVPCLALRTTVLVGFPGETEEDYRSLLDFLEEVEFDRLGAFAFSPQDGTRAADMEVDFLPEGLAGERLEELLEVQRAISAARLAREVGARRDVLVDRVAGASAAGRTAGQADDVDGVTELEGVTGDVSPGTIVEAEIVAAHDYDLSARACRVLRPAPASAPEATEPPAAGESGARGRRLPLAPLGLDAAHGR
ncbi:MAG: 30S ribosomal protein S12 methylthiotransferase RimO [Gemmatimonadota bacterium]|nr:30S ribosomal protein S12 methylthiotransferase RimO [Gemmatimonadota bacterium]